MKKLLAAALATTITVGSTMPITAGQWQQNTTGYWYQEDNGSYPVNTWKWVDGNGDGVAECYYFDGNGYMLSSTTSDGYTVNGSGAWVENGVVQTQRISANASVNAAYPLAGMLEQLGLNDTGVEGWSDAPNLNMRNGPYLRADGKYEYINYGYGALDAFACALSGEKYHDYWNEVTDPIQIIAGYNSVSYEESRKMVGIVRDFLNSFDWKNADDMTKAKKAAELVTNGTDYGNPTAGYVSGILLDKAGGCNHFAATYHLLTRLMGMDSLHVVYIGHEINFVKINGTWYEFDGSEHAMYHTNYVFRNINAGNFISMTYPNAEERAKLGIY